MTTAKAKSLKDWAKNRDTQGQHIVCVAGAGTGKTTTLMGAIGAIYGIQVGEHSPSPQQSAIFEAVKQGEKPKTITALAFNKSIVKELSDNYQWLIDALEKVGVTLKFCTIHSLGNGAVYKAYGRTKASTWRTINLLERETEKKQQEIDKKWGDGTTSAINSLVHFCKVTLAGYDRVSKVFNVGSVTDEDLDHLVAFYGIDILSSTAQEFAYPMVRTLLQQSLAVRNEIDFDDMIWLPIVQNLPLPSTGLLLVDEAQDLNRCQHELALRTGQRLFVVGDDNQAINGFAGADIGSIDKLMGYLEETGKGVVRLPLTVTYRCGKTIVDEANRKWLPTPVSEEFAYRAANGNVQGEVIRLPSAELATTVQDADMILCRTNAPLVGMFFRLLKEGTKAYIQGRDGAGQILGLAKKLLGLNGRKKLGTSGQTVEALLDRLDAWYLKEVETLEKRKRPSEEAKAALEDKKDCLQLFAEQSATLAELEDTVNRIFSDDTKEGVRLSSCHRAKGLEADNVYLIHPEKLPHPMARTPEAKLQERNLGHVAVTRAKLRFAYVDTK